MCREFTTCIDSMISLAPLYALMNRGFSPTLYGIRDSISPVDIIQRFYNIFPIVCQEQNFIKIYHNRLGSQ